jgi:hypothetical protein
MHRNFYVGCYLFVLCIPSYASEKEAESKGASSGEWTVHHESPVAIDSEAFLAYTPLPSVLCMIVAKYAEQIWQLTKTSVKVPFDHMSGPFVYEGKKNCILGWDSYSVYLFDSDTGACIQSVYEQDDHDALITAAVFLPIKRKIVLGLGCSAYSIDIWDDVFSAGSDRELKQSACLKKLKGHGDRIIYLEPSRDEALLASSSLTLRGGRVSMA